MSTTTYAERITTHDWDLIVSSKRMRTETLDTRPMTFHGTREQVMNWLRHLAAAYYAFAVTVERRNGNGAPRRYVLGRPYTATLVRFD